MKSNLENTAVLTMVDDDEVPDDREDEPGEEEGGGEPQQRPRPGEVDHRDKEVLQVPEQR